MYSKKIYLYIIILFVYNFLKQNISFIKYFNIVFIQNKKKAQ